MVFETTEFTDRKGSPYRIRSLVPEDAAALTRFVEKAQEETPYFPWASGDTALNAENAGEYIKDFMESERRLLLGAFHGDEIIGLNELSNYGSYSKSLHRCTSACGVLKVCQGRGIGKTLFETVFPLARNAGYEQIESNVATENEISYRNLLSLGFQEYGIIPHKKKFEDGSYEDEHRMIKWLI